MTAAVSPQPASPARPGVWTVAGLAAVIILAAITRFLDANVSGWLAGTPLGGVSKAIEYPVYAILLGLVGNFVLTTLGVLDRMRAAFRTELFIKTGLVLLGASINLSIIVSAAGPALAQSVILITCIFLFTYWLAGVAGVDQKLRALLAAAVSICGVSAAIAAAGAVQAKKEQLAYAASLVILFAIPSIFIQPWLASVMGLSHVVAGAWIGGNIDTTAAVTAAGTLVGDDALKVATIVKVTQNALMGVVAVLLSLYYVTVVDRESGAPRPGVGELWRRFPKFVIGFIAASVIATLWLGSVPKATGDAAIAAINAMRTWALILAFVSIGLELRVSSLREAGWKPVGVFAAATVANLTLALVLAQVLFGNFVLAK